MESTVLKGRRNFVVLGNTADESKYAYKIKKALSDNGPFRQRLCCHCGS